VLPDVAYVDGKVFHRRGAAAAKLLSPELVEQPVFFGKMNGDEDDHVFICVGCVAQLAERRSFTGELTLSCARPAADE